MAQPKNSPDKIAPNRQEVVERLIALESVLRSRNVQSLFLFGSVARDEAQRDSDIDIAVQIKRPFSVFDLSGLTLYLEEQLACPVDVLVDGEETPENQLDHLPHPMRQALDRDRLSVF